MDFSELIFEYPIPRLNVLVGCIGFRNRVQLDNGSSMFTFKGCFYNIIDGEVVPFQKNQVSPLELKIPFQSEDCYDMWKRENGVSNTRPSNDGRFLHYKLNNGTTVDMPIDVNNPFGLFPYLNFNNPLNKGEHCDAVDARERKQNETDNISVPYNIDAILQQSFAVHTWEELDKSIHTWEELDKELDLSPPPPPSSPICNS